ncbi:MAG: four helix bundle protein [Chloroflexi bacterium]|nr:four helix bundle protein [Chloroflexota bacterium]
MATKQGQGAESVKGVEGLRCYQLALELFKAAYKLVAAMPDYEKYNMASQLRRAALSAVLNIAEGYGRYHYLDKLRFFYMARGSLTETRSAFTTAHIAGYTTMEQRDWAHSTEAEAQRSLNGYIAFIRRQHQGQEEFGAKVLRPDR